MEPHKDRFVEELLEASLAHYRSAEPRPGLENRILAQLRAAPKASPWRVWLWRLGAGLAAVAVVLVVVSVRYRVRPHAPESVVESAKRASAVEASRTPARRQ